VQLSIGSGRDKAVFSWAGLSYWIFGSGWVGFRYFDLCRLWPECCCTLDELSIQVDSGSREANYHRTLTMSKMSNVNLYSAFS